MQSYQSCISCILRSKIAALSIVCAEVSLCASGRARLFNSDYKTSFECADVRSIHDRGGWTRSARDPPKTL
jgi:hypothetical protein